MRLFAALALAALAACAAPPPRETRRPETASQMDPQPLLLTSETYVPRARPSELSFHVELPRFSYRPPSWFEIEQLRARYGGCGCCSPMK